MTTKHIRTKVLTFIADISLFIRIHISVVNTSVKMTTNNITAAVHEALTVNVNNTIFAQYKMIDDLYDLDVNPQQLKSDIMLNMTTVMSDQVYIEHGPVDDRLSQPIDNLMLILNIVTQTTTKEQLIDDPVTVETMNWVRLHDTYRSIYD